MGESPRAADRREIGTEPERRRGHVGRRAGVGDGGGGGLGLRPAGARTTLAAPVSAGIATGDSTKENLTAEVETGHATEEANLKAAAVYLYVLIRSR